MLLPILTEIKKWIKLSRFDTEQRTSRGRAPSRGRSCNEKWKERNHRIIHGAALFITLGRWISAGFSRPQGSRKIYYKLFFHTFISPWWKNQLPANRGSKLRRPEGIFPNGIPACNDELRSQRYTMKNAHFLRGDDEMFADREKNFYSENFILKPLFEL